MAIESCTKQHKFVERSVFEMTVGIRIIALLVALILSSANLLVVNASSWRNELNDSAEGNIAPKASRTSPRTRPYRVPPTLDGRSLAQKHRLASSLASFSSLFETSSTRSGVLPLETTKRIIGGAPISEKENYAFSAGSELCGGTLIHEDIVLTAARKFWTRSFFKTSQNVYPDCEGIFLDGVLLGGTTIDGAGSTLIPVATEFPHPDYDGGNTENNDIMLVQLATPAPSNVALQQLNFDDNVPADGATLSALGYGNTADGGTASFTLLGVDLEAASFDTCNSHYGFIVDATMVCAISSEGKDTCQGDSGGPLLLGDLQVGLVSFGDGCGQPNVPSVYARISGFEDFITNGICDLSANPPSSCFPTDPPVDSPTDAPVTSPTDAPIVSPVAAPVAPPVAASPTDAPVVSPVAAPVAPPVAASPTDAPVVSPVAPPVAAPVVAPLTPPVSAPVTPPVVSPAAPPVAAPVDVPVVAPDSAPVATPTTNSPTLIADDGTSSPILATTPMPTPKKQDDSPTVRTPVAPALPSIVLIPSYLSNDDDDDDDKKEKSEKKKESEKMVDVFSTNGPSTPFPSRSPVTAPPTTAGIPTTRIVTTAQPSKSGGKSEKKEKSKSEKKGKKGGDDDDDDDDSLASDRSQSFWALWQMLTGDNRNKDFDIDGIVPVPRKYHQELNQWVEMRLQQQKEEEQSETSKKSKSSKSSKGSKRRRRRT